MGWDKGRYYTRTRRAGPSFVRSYIGGGVAGERAAALDMRRRELRRARREREERRRVRFEGLIAYSVELDAAVRLVMRSERASRTD
jgi:hypothetical protein